MPLFALLLVVAAMGLVGGIINALTSDNGFLLPQFATVTDQARILRPGFLGNAFIGAVAAGVSWGLYGPFAGSYVFGSAPAGVPANQPVGLTLAAMASAVLVGIGGARWLTNEVDKKLLRAAASLAANKPRSQVHAPQIAIASPADALRLVRAMPNQ